MERSELDRKLKLLISEQLGVNESEVVPSASLSDDLGGDSLDMVELVMEVEEEFDIEIPDSAFEDENGNYLSDFTVEQFIEKVAEHINPQNG